MTQNLFPRLARVAASCGAMLVSLGGSACSSGSKLPPLKTVQHVDLPRYMGDWYVIAHIPYSLERGKVGTLDRYSLKSDGSIDNRFLFRRGRLDAPLQEWKAKAWVHNTQTNAEWRVQFLWPFRVAYLILDLDKDYRWTVVGHPKRKLGWVLSKSPTLDEKTYQGIVERMGQQGYDTSKLAKVPQVSARP